MFNLSISLSLIQLFPMGCIPVCHPETPPPSSSKYSIPSKRSNSRGKGGKICFFAEAWKATICDTPAAFLFTSGDERKADRQDCLSIGDWRAIEAIIDSCVGQD